MMIDADELDDHSDHRRKTACFQHELKPRQQMNVINMPDQQTSSE